MLIRQFTQISEAHCGAAVLQTLLETLGITSSQQLIAEMAGVTATIEENGMRVDQIAMASNKVAPNVSFWYKFYSTLDDVKYLLSRNIAVGVEWQGLFYNSLEEELSEGKDGEYGHYSVISFFDEELDQLVIVDPYKYFVNRNRIFSAETFLNRWWDENEIVDSLTHKTQISKDVRLLFFVTNADEFMPPEFGFKQFNMIEEQLTRS